MLYYTFDMKYNQLIILDMITVFLQGNIHINIVISIIVASELIIYFGFFVIKYIKNKIHNLI